MDPAKVSFLFGGPSPGLDPDDPDARMLFFCPEQDEDGPAGIEGAARTAIADQIAGDDPPETWQTVQRLLGMGIDPEKAMAQLSTVFLSLAGEAAGAGRRFDAEAYLRALDALPPPPPEQMMEALERVARANHPAPPEELEELALRELGRDSGDQATRELLRQLTDRLIEFEIFDYLVDDRVVHVEALTAGITLTHQLAQIELEAGTIRLAPDLTPFWSHEELRLAGGDPIEPYGVSGEIFWSMPAGWAESLVDESMIALTVDEAGSVTLALLESAPPEDPELVSRLRRAYDALVEGPDLPVYVRNIVYELLAEDPRSFGKPRLPLADLCRAAGLEVRGELVAHTDELWAKEASFNRFGRAYDRFEGDESRYRKALDALEVAAAAEPARVDLRMSLKGMLDPEVAQFVVDELVPEGEPTEEQVLAATQFARSLLHVAAGGTPTAVANWLAAVIAERAGDTLLAEAHLQRGLAQGGDWAPVVERAAWYASDRGDAEGALDLLRRMPSPDPTALSTLEPLEHSSQTNLGRNEPCWCGSGRKFKHCHLNEVAYALPDRVGWLSYKAASYLNHNAVAQEELMMLAEARAVDPDDEESLAEALQDPIIVDVLLNEGGWFERFLIDRGDLLPDDELLLAESWLLVDRTVYEVEEVWPGQGLAVRDLATGERLDVRERTASRTLRRGWMICARAVPDGRTHQFVGSVFPVPPGAEEAALDLCDDGDPYELCSYVGALSAPPTLQTREGELMVACNAVWQVADPKAARVALDQLYDPTEPDVWSESFSLSEEERVLRAQLRLDGSQLHVITTSEERMDRVLEALESGVDGFLLSDRRVPVEIGRDLPDDIELPVSTSQGDPEDLPAVMAEMRQNLEDRWLDEPVPALKGLTPREAAADPTRREQVERLLARFEDPGEPSEGFSAFRPDRLRKELGLSPD